MVWMELISTVRGSGTGDHQLVVLVLHLGAWQGVSSADLATSEGVAPLLWRHPWTLINLNILYWRDV